MREVANPDTGSAEGLTGRLAPHLALRDESTLHFNVIYFYLLQIYTKQRYKLQGMMI